MSGKRLDVKRAAPDILDCIANLSSDEVFTPPRLVNQMLDLLPKDVWTNPDLKWLDPGTKTGVFLREIAKRLMDHLAEAIPDEDARREHIYKNMLYGLPITELTSMLARRSLYYSKDADHERYAVVRMGSSEGNIPFTATEHGFKNGACSQCGAPESLERGESRENYAYPFIHSDQLPEEFSDMKFDVIVGNPPYQIGDGGETSASPIYQKFIETAIDMSPRFVLMIVPSRWFAGGKGLDQFRERMIADRSIRVIADYTDATDCFPGVEIKGGVNYFLWDREYSGDCNFRSMSGNRVSSVATRDLRNGGGVLIRSNEAVSILEKVQAVGEGTADSLVYSQTPFGLYTNFSGFELEPQNGFAKLFMRGGTSWVDRNLIMKNPGLLDKHKVLVSKAYNGGESKPHQITGRPIVADTNSCCTQTYLVVGAFENKLQAENFARYLETRFARFLISLRKIAQDMRPSVFAFVPVVDMNLTWTDEMLFNRYSLSEDEILFIKSQIKEMP